MRRTARKAFRPGVPRGRRSSLPTGLLLFFLYVALMELISLYLRSILPFGGHRRLPESLLFEELWFGGSLWRASLGQALLGLNVLMALYLWSSYRFERLMKTWPRWLLVSVYGGAAVVLMHLQYLFYNFSRALPDAKLFRVPQ